MEEIQSCAEFLSAAIKRNPKCTKYKQDYNDLWRFVLDQAEVEQNQAELYEFSKELSVSVKKMRDFAKTELAQVRGMSEALTGQRKVDFKHEYIDTIQSIQSSLTEKYTEIMRNLLRKCFALLDTTLGNYVILAYRKLYFGEINPFSTFSPLFVVENLSEDSNQNDEPPMLFKNLQWASLIFNMIILSLSETTGFLFFRPLPDGYSTNIWRGIKVGARGVAFQCPPASDALTLQDVSTVQSFDAAVKYLKRFLHPIHYVDGDVKLYRQIIQSVGNEFDTEHIEKNLDITTADLYVFDTHRLNFTLNQHNGRIKHVIHRCVYLFIRLLGADHSITSNSVVEIIKRLEDKKHISTKIAYHLRFAASYVCHVRLASCLLQNGRHYHLNEDDYYTLEDGNCVKILSNIAGERFLVDAVEIARALLIFLDTDKWVLDPLITERLRFTFKTWYFLKLNLKICYECCVGAVSDDERQPAYGETKI